MVLREIEKVAWPCVPLVLGFSVSSALGGMPLFGPAVVPVRVLADSYGYFMRPGLPWQAIPIVSGRVTPKSVTEG